MVEVALSQDTTTLVDTTTIAPADTTLSAEAPRAIRNANYTLELVIALLVCYLDLFNLYAFYPGKLLSYAEYYSYLRTI